MCDEPAGLICMNRKEAPMTIVDSQEGFADLGEGNILIGDAPEFDKSKVVFNGSGNVLFCEKGVKLVTSVGNWEHPSWSRDSRNVVAARDKALFVVDTSVDGGNLAEPCRVFNADGKWINPSWNR